MQKERNRREELRPYIEILSFWGESIEDYLFVFDVEQQQFYFSSCIWEKYPLPFMDISFGMEDWISVIDIRDRNRMVNNLEELKTGQTDQINLEYRMIDRKGVSVWVNCIGKCVSYDDGKPSIIVGNISENVVSKKIDQLTGLQNQTVLEGIFQEAFQKDETGYFLVVGIDDFKNVNDKYGRKYGDEQLKKLAEIIDKNLDYDSQLYRLDGDKFGVNLVGYTQENTRAFYERIKMDFSIQTYSTVSAGAAGYPMDVNNYHNLYQYAEDALNQSKQQGKNKLSFFSLDNYKGHLFFIDLKEEILESIKNNFEGFYIYYQPVVKNEDGTLVKSEALMRWRSKQYGEISPVVFIPILEQTGLILEAGKWILQNAMKQCHAWREFIPNFRMNINLSYIQLKDKKLMEIVLDALNKADLPGSAIILEVTESIQLQDYSYFNLLFYQLNKKGIQISIDDFGTGYSSLGYLKELRVDEIKIDRCFVKSIQEGGYNSHLIKNMIELAHSVNIRVCVEGVETIEERTVLKKLSPDVIQGYYFGKPETPDNFFQKFITKAKNGEPIVDDGERKVVSENNNLLKKNSKNYQNLLDELDDIIYVCDAETYELYYINKLGKKLTGVFDYSGKKCYEVFQKDKQICADCHKEYLVTGTFHTKVKRKKEVEFLIKEKLIVWDGKQSRLVIVTDTGEGYKSRT